MQCISYYKIIVDIVEVFENPKIERAGEVTTKTFKIFKNCGKSNFVAFR